MDFENKVIILTYAFLTIWKSELSCCIHCNVSTFIIFEVYKCYFLSLYSKVSNLYKNYLPVFITSYPGFHISFETPKNIKELFFFNARRKITDVKTYNFLL